MKLIERLHINRGNWFGWAALALTVAICIAWQSQTWYTVDDFPYSHMAGEESVQQFWHIQGPEIQSFSQVPQAVVNHYLTINARWSNLAYVAVQPLPHMLIQLLNGCMMGLLAVLLFNVAGLRRTLRSAWLAMGIAVVYWMGLQWDESMQSADFQFNYTWPSVMMVYLMLVFCARRFPVRWYTWVVLGFFAFWHESFTIILGCFLGAQWLMDRRKEYIIVIGILIVGTLYQISPGSLYRMSTQHPVEVRYYPFTRMVWRMWPAFVAVAWWLWRRRQLDGDTRRMLDRTGLGVLAAMFAGIALTMGLGVAERTHWPTEIAGIYALILIASTYSLKWHVPVWARIVFLVLYAGWGASLAWWQAQTSAFNKSVHFQLVENANGVAVDRDDFVKRVPPFWLMNMTTPMYGYHNKFPHVMMGMSAGHGFSHYILLSPENEGKPFSQWPAVPGHSGIRMPSPGQLATTQPVRPGHYWLEVTYGDANIGVSPMDWVAAKLTGEPVKTRETVSWVAELPYMGDTVYTLYTAFPPKRAQHRRILEIELKEIPEDQLASGVE